MEELKKFKLIRTIKERIESPLTHRLHILKNKMECLQMAYPNDDFAIVDEQGNPAQIDDFIAADLAHPVAKANQAKAEEYKAEVKQRLKRM